MTKEINLPREKRMLVVAGNPISHSLSPIMHSAALTSAKLDYLYGYKAFLVEDKSLREFIQKIRDGKIYGANVTLPYKTAIIPYLDELTPEASSVGAVNTIFRRDGKLVGHNTDYPGFLMSLNEAQIEIKGKSVLVLGSGGSSRAIVPAIVVNNPFEIYLMSRNLDSANVLAESLGKKIKVISLDKDSIKKSVPNSNLIINCTPLGMKGKFEDQTLIYSHMLNKNQTIVDLVYNPSKTKLLVEAEKAGCKTLNGLSMLVYQGALGFELFTGIKANTAIMKKSLEDFLKY